MQRSAIVLLRVCLVAVLFGTVLVQVFVALLAFQLAWEYPEFASLRWPYTVAAIAAVVCVQVALVQVWRLLNRLAQDRLFDATALRPVDVIIGCALGWTALSAAVWVHLLFVARTGGPSGLLLMTAAVVGGATAASVMAVLRGILQSAIADRRELAEVI